MSNRPKYTICLLILYILFISLKTASGEKWLKNELKNPNAQIYVDTWADRNNDFQEQICKLFIQINPVDLVFHREEGIGYKSCYEINVHLWDDENRYADGRFLRDIVIVKKFSETENIGLSRLHELEFRLTEGNYTAHISLTDKNINKEAILQKSFKVSCMDNSSVSISEIVLTRSVDVQKDDTTYSQTVLPYPARIYGCVQPRLYCYFEINFPKESKLDSLDYVISYIDPEMQETIVQNCRIPRNPKSVPINYSFDTRNLTPGHYILQIRANVINEAAETISKKSFIVHQSPIDLRFNSFRKILDEIEIIAGESKIFELEQLLIEDRQKGLDDFWKRRDPTPHTCENEIMTEFYKRIKLAQRYFNQTSSEGGYFSDPGKVYILCGPPQFITKKSTSHGMIFMQIWHYEKQNMDVVFMDDLGFGSFSLVSPGSLIKKIGY